MTTFISIPITGKDIDEAKRHCQGIKELVYNGKAITPFDTKDWELGKSWEWYMARTLEMLRTCDQIYMCQGWEDSKGCRLELAYARYLGKMVVYE